MNGQYGLYEPCSLFQFKDSELSRDRSNRDYSLKVTYGSSNLWVVDSCELQAKFLNGDYGKTAISDIDE